MIDRASNRPETKYTLGHCLPYLGVGLLALSSCNPHKRVPPSAGSDQITQVSVINALMIGRYDGVMQISELLQYGDFGVGTLDHLDGELIVLDGRAYQIRGDGEVVDVGSHRTTPFAVVTPFEMDGEFSCPQVVDLSGLEAHLDRTLQGKNNFVAIRVDARFASITLRSVHRQEPPYKPLGEVAKDQSVWTHEDINGTLVGIRSPGWASGLSVSGYHWHFLSANRKVGGHVLNCWVREGRVRYDVRHNWLIKLDGSADFNKAELDKDYRQDLRRVESSRSVIPER